MNPTVIELPAHELKTALTGLGKVINRHSSLPVLSHVRVTRDPENKVSLEATDLDSTAIYQAEQASPGLPASFLVPFAPLNQLVKGCKAPVQLIAEDQQVRVRTYIGTSPMEQSFAALPVDEFPPSPQATSKPLVLDATFRDSFREALDCCSDEGSRHVIQHVCLDTRDAEGHYVAATDGRHLYAANSFHFDLKEPVLIPNRDFLRWNKLMESGVGELTLKPKTAKEGSWVQLKSGAWTFITKAGDDAFPNWKQVLPTADSHLTRVQLNPEAVGTLLAGVPKLPSEDDYNRGVRLDITPTQFTVQARRKDAAEWTRLAVDGAQVIGKSIGITLNRDYLLKALRYGLTTLALTDDLSPIVFSEGGRRMVVMPLRSGDAPQAQPAATPQPAPPTAESSAPNPTITNPPVAEPTPLAQPQETTMPKETQTIPTEPQPTTETSPVKAVIEHVEHIKETLKGVLKEFAEVMDGLKVIEKEKRATDKEIESVREKLREIQSVRI